MGLRTKLTLPNGVTVDYSYDTLSPCWLLRTSSSNQS